ncbi:MAG: DNA polymerase Y family protein [Saccharofermentanales bacterium]
MNNFFASVECLQQPDFRDKPVAVCGAAEMRQGIVLAKNGVAKSLGILTGESIPEAKAKCPDLVVVKPHYPLYLKYAKLARRIYSDYTDEIIVYGLDEAWLDVTKSQSLYGGGVAIADRIRARVKDELGLTISVGVSFNKIFSKLGSDMKKPDATTVISRDDFKDIVWRLPAKELLFVGKSVQHKLFLRNIISIGDLAMADPLLLKKVLGKIGLVLWQFANGDDSSFIPEEDDATLIKSIGNNTTPPRNLNTPQDVKLLLYVLADSVSTRLRSNRLNAKTIQIHVKDSRFNTREFQTRLGKPTQCSSEIFAAAMDLFSKQYSWKNPVRTIGIRATNLESSVVSQITLFDAEGPAKESKLEYAVDEIRKRFGYFSIERALVLRNKNMFELPVQSEYTVGTKIRKY